VQADIFLRYLQGAESLEFDLACNSSVLNSWIKTPLELAGIIVPAAGKRYVCDEVNEHTSRIGAGFVTGKN